MRVLQKFDVFIYTDTSNAPDDISLDDLGVLHQERIRVALTQKGIGYGRDVFYQESESLDPINPMGE